MNVKAHHTLKQLLHLYKTQSDPRLARRIHAICLARQELTCPEIMQITSAGRRTIQQWISKYNRNRIQGLRDKPRPGQPRKLPSDLEERFCRRINGGPQEEDGVSVLNGPAIRRILEREFGILCSLRTVHLLLHRLGYSCLCPRPQHEHADPQLRAAFKKTSRKHSQRSR